MDHHEHHHSNAKYVSQPPMPDAKKFSTYIPLIIILAVVVAAAFGTAYAIGNTHWQTVMRLFMGYFFAIFSFFKFLDLRGFADAYSEYDLIAKRSRLYAFSYPFIEALLAVAYFFNWQPTVTNIATSVVMVVSGAGVLYALLDKCRIRCACLGAVIKLPMTTVTLIEDLGMAAMAFIMLITT